MPVDSQVQAILDQYDEFVAPPIAKLSPENARNKPDAEKRGRRNEC